MRADRIIPVGTVTSADERIQRTPNSPPISALSRLLCISKTLDLKNKPLAHSRQFVPYRQGGCLKRRPGSNWLTLEDAIQIVGGADQGQVCERLREIAQSFALRSCL